MGGWAGRRDVQRLHDLLCCCCCVEILNEMRSSRQQGALALPSLSTQPNPTHPPTYGTLPS